MLNATAAEMKTNGSDSFKSPPKQCETFLQHGALSDRKARARPVLKACLLPSCPRLGSYDCNLPLTGNGMSNLQRDGLITLLEESHTLKVPSENDRFCLKFRNTVQNR